MPDNDDARANDDSEPSDAASAGTHAPRSHKVSALSALKRARKQLDGVEDSSERQYELMLATAQVHAMLHLADALRPDTDDK